MLNSRWYFAYGSNMNPDRVCARGLVCVAEPIAGKLWNFRLRFNKRSRKNPEAGHANIVADFSSSVEGVLYHLCDEHEISKMDPFESAPSHYRRELVFVETEDSLILAWTYIANDSVIDDSLFPPKWYIEHLLAGSQFLSSEYVDQLKSIECNTLSVREPS